MNKAKQKNKEECPEYLNRPFTLAELKHDLANIKTEPYSNRQFEDSHLTQFMHEQLTIVTLTLNLLGVTSILLSFLQSIAPLGEDQKVLILAIQSVISFGLVVLVSVKHFKGIELK